MHTRRLLLVVLAVLLFTGCSGADAQRAQSLLDRASLAEAKARSLSFSGSVRIQEDGQELSVRVSGGLYLRGPRAGDMLLDTELTGTASALVGAPFHRIRLGIVDRRVWSEVDGRRNEPLDLRGLPRGDALPADARFAAFDPTHYVTDVRVDGGQVVNGRPMTKIVGTL